MKLPIITVLALLLISGASAQMFDYVQNPSVTYLRTFDGGSSTLINDNTTARTGNLFLHTWVSDGFCFGGTITNTSVSVIRNPGTKNTRDCMDGSGTINVYVGVDNPNYASTQFAKIGDYASNGNYITVLPYSYNTWQSENRKNTYNSVVYDEVERRMPDILDTDAYWATPQGRGDIKWYSPGTDSLFPLYLWKVKNKGGVCSSEVKTALRNKNYYYSHPAELYVNGYGTVNADTCDALMFPGSGSLDRVDGMLKEYPQVLHSVYYDEDLQYHSYPMTIEDIELRCYGGGKVLSSTTLTEKRLNAVGTLGGEKSVVGTQYYSWENVGNYKEASPGNTEIMNQGLSITCPTGTTMYAASVVLYKNRLYRHKSPMDSTWYWSDVFNKPVSSVIKPGAAQDEFNFIVLTHVGFISSTPGTDIGTINQTNTTGNVDQNKITENTSGNGVTGTDAPQDCYACTQNITGANLTGGGGASGGSVIGDSTDDSAVSDLIGQIEGKERVETKASFMEKLKMVGELLLTLIVVLYGIIALLGMIAFIALLFSIPGKMKQTVIDLFNAGGRK